MLEFAIAAKDILLILFFTSSFEYGQSAGVSLMHRMIISGHPSVMLRTQYRMHSQIADLVNVYFYHKQLSIESCFMRRSEERVFRD